MRNLCRYRKKNIRTFNRPDLIGMGRKLWILRESTYLYRRELIRKLTVFWEEIFENSYEDFKPIFAGDETEDNADILYLMREGEDLAGTSHLTVGKAVPRLGGLGEVATPPAFRRQGIRRPAL